VSSSRPATGEAGNNPLSLLLGFGTTAPFRNSRGTLATKRQTLEGFQFCGSLGVDSMLPARQHIPGNPFLRGKFGTILKRWNVRRHDS
jgi:hypothetical protein